MRPNPFVRFHRAAEAAGYPSLLVVSIVCLAIVVAPIALLALSPTAVALAFAILSLVVAVAILSAAIAATFADSDQRPDRQPAEQPAASQRAAALPLRGRPAATRPRAIDREAA